MDDFARRRKRSKDEQEARAAQMNRLLDMPPTPVVEWDIPTAHESYTSMDSPSDLSSGFEGGESGGAGGGDSY